MVAKRTLVVVLVVMLLFAMVPRPAAGGGGGGCGDDAGCNNTMIGIAIAGALIIVGLVVYGVLKHRQRSSASNVQRSPDRAAAPRPAATGGEEARSLLAYTASGLDVQAP